MLSPLGTGAVREATNEFWAVDAVSRVDLWCEGKSVKPWLRGLDEKAVVCRLEAWQLLAAVCAREAAQSEARGTFKWSFQTRDRVSLPRVLESAAWALGPNRLD